MDRGNVNQEPLFSCCNCYEDYSWPAADLAVHEDSVWCQSCWEYAQDEEKGDWSDLPVFMSHLESLCRKVVETSEGGTAVGIDTIKAIRELMAALEGEQDG